MSNVKPIKRAVRYSHPIGVKVDDETFAAILDRRQPLEPVAEATRRIILAGLTVVTQPEKQPEITA